jgi:hypothetical protein
MLASNVGVLGRIALALQVLWPSSGTAVAGTCFAGQPCFPSASELDEFNKSVDGQLFAERPIGAVCYAKDVAYNEKECLADIPNFFNGTWIVDHFPAYVDGVLPHLPSSLNFCY